MLAKDELFNKKLAMVQGDKCDKYDYLIAAFCGLSAGIIDAFFVGAPGTSVLGNKVDVAADIFVQRAAQIFWRFDSRDHRPRKMPESLTQSISYLEQAFPVPYDARYAVDLEVAEGVLSGMTPKSHHLMSLAHSPDIIGLIFSIIDQFSNMGSFIDHGKIIRACPARTSNAIPYLQGNDTISRLFCGCINWLGHMLSDIAGSSSTRQQGKTGRGMGIPIPFYELFLLCDLSSFDGPSFAEIAINVFERGYDLRHGATLAIPIMLNEFMVRVLWSIKRKVYHGYAWKNCVPTDSHPDLRCMLLVSEGALCLIDGVDAVVRANGNLIEFILRLNLVAWFKLILMIFKEIAIRYNFTYEDLHFALQRINAELDAYLEKLKAINYADYERELEDLRNINFLLMNTCAGEEEIYSYLAKADLNLQFCSFDEFDEKMQDKDFVLEI